MLELLLTTASSVESSAALDQQGTLHQMEQTLGLSSRMYWESTNQQGLDLKKLFVVDVTSTEYATVAADFFCTMSSRTITRMERVENGPQHQAFHLAAAAVKQQLGGRYGALPSLAANTP
jgi:hypothetical protein